MWDRPLACLHGRDAHFTLRWNTLLSSALEREVGRQRFTLVIRERSPHRAPPRLPVSKTSVERRVIVIAGIEPDFRFSV